MRLDFVRFESKVDSVRISSSELTIEPGGSVTVSGFVTRKSTPKRGSGGAYRRDVAAAPQHASLTQPSRVASDAFAHAERSPPVRRPDERSGFDRDTRAKTRASRLVRKYI